VTKTIIHTSKTKAPKVCLHLKEGYLLLSILIAALASYLVEICPDIKHHSTKSTVNGSDIKKDLLQFSSKTQISISNREMKPSKNLEIELEKVIDSICQSITEGAI
jgi:hypothetical protein